MKTPELSELTASEMEASTAALDELQTAGAAAEFLCCSCFSFFLDGLARAAAEWNAPELSQK